MGHTQVCRVTTPRVCPLLASTGGMTTRPVELLTHQIWLVTLNLNLCTSPPSSFCSTISSSGFGYGSLRSASNSTRELWRCLRSFWPACTPCRWPHMPCGASPGTGHACSFTQTSSQRRTVQESHHLAKVPSAPAWPQARCPAAHLPAPRPPPALQGLQYEAVSAQ